MLVENQAPKLYLQDWTFSFQERALLNNLETLLGPGYKHQSEVTDDPDAFGIVDGNTFLIAVKTGPTVLPSLHQKEGKLPAVIITDSRFTDSNSGKLKDLFSHYDKKLRRSNRIYGIHYPEAGPLREDDEQMVLLFRKD